MVKLYGRNYGRECQVAESIGLDWDTYRSLICKRVKGRMCMHCESRIHNARGQYCVLRPSSRSENGYKRVCAHDDACGLYNEKMR